MTAMAVAANPTPKAMATMRPEVVRLLSRLMQEFAPGVAEKHIIPGAQEAISVVVATQDWVLPPETTHWDVDFVVVTEQTRGPVVVAESAVAVDVRLELELELDVLVVEEAVVSVEEVVEVVDSVVDSDVVVASVDEGAVVDVVLADVVLLVVFLVVVSSVVLSSVVVVSSCLLFNSSCPARQSKVSQTASAVASAIEHPPETKQSSISSSRARSMSPCKHSEIALFAPQDILATRSSRLFWAHPVADTIAAEANNAKSVERMTFDSAFSWNDGGKG